MVLEDLPGNYRSGGDARAAGAGALCALKRSVEKNIVRISHENGIKQM
jgi:hypothetical protein